MGLWAVSGSRVHFGLTMYEALKIHKLHDNFRYWSFVKSRRLE